MLVRRLGFVANVATERLVLRRAVGVVLRCPGAMGVAYAHASLT